LKSLIEYEENLKVPEDDDFFLKFLRAGLMSPEEALNIMKNYFKLKKDYPQYFKRSTDLEWLKMNILRKQIHCVLPKRDKHGRRVFVFRPGLWDPDQVPFIDIFCVGIMMAEMVIREEETQIAGLTSITDASGFSFKHMRAIGLEDGKNMVNFYNISFPLWLRQSHVLNAPRVFNMLFSLLNPLMSQNARENVIFHSSLSSLRDHLGADILPSDLGGLQENGIMDNSQNVETLATMEEFFRSSSNHGYHNQ